MGTPSGIANLLLGIVKVACVFESKLKIWALDQTCGFLHPRNETVHDFLLDVCAVFHLGLQCSESRI